MKLVTLLEKAPKMASEYVPRDVHYWHMGRAIRLATGALVIEIFLAIDSITLRSVILSFRRFLDILFYVGLLASLEGQRRSFTHPEDGLDLREPAGTAFGKSGTEVEFAGEIGRIWIEERRGIMHFEAGLGATILALLLALA